MTKSTTITSTRKGSEALQRLLAVGRDQRVNVPIGEHAGQGVTLALMIVADEEDAARNRSARGHFPLSAVMCRSNADRYRAARFGPTAANGFSSTDELYSPKNRPRFRGLFSGAFDAR
jgi:hypothetical protein